MAGYDKGPGFMAGVILGSLVGAAVSIVMAARASEETRRQWMERGSEVKSRVDDLVTQAKSTVGDQSLRETLEDIREIIREAAAEAKEFAKEAVDQGKDASSRAKTDLQDRFERSRSGDIQGPTS